MQEDVRKQRCPRCGGALYLTRAEVARRRGVTMAGLPPETLIPPAFSRTDNETEICTLCGVAEATQGLDRETGGTKEDWTN